MIEIKAGEELDKAVAEAAGIECKITHTHNFPICHLTRAGAESLSGVLGAWPVTDGANPFIPSRDLNAAFAAAEKVGMFLELTRLSSEWMATTHALKGKYETASTPCLAICAAILTLKGQ